MTRKQLEENLGRQLYIRLFDGTEHIGILHKTGEDIYKSNPNLFIPRNYYFLTDDAGRCKSCLFRVSHIRKMLKVGRKQFEIKKVEDG